MAPSTISSSSSTLLDEFSPRKENLIPILQKIQSSKGYISHESVRVVSRKLRISENEIHGVVSFYAQFRFTPPGEHSIHVCMGTACHVRGGEQILNSLEYRLGIKAGETTSDMKYDLTRVACLGCCALAPVVKIEDKIHIQMSVLKTRRLLDEYDGIGREES
jgi:NADH-quinone oxidoreductase subunit E